MSSGMSYRLEPLNSTDGDTAADLAYLHGALLGHSPVALLGPAFMREFYYRDLPRMGLITGAVAYVDDRPAGFIVGTTDSSGFMQKALRARFLAVAWVMFRSVLTSPARIGAVWEALQIMRNLPPATGRDAGMTGEILSFGVLPEFRNRYFMLKRRLRVSQDLLKKVLGQLGEKGISKARVIVDADNLEARLFYLGNGWQPGMDVVPGWRKKTVEFLWPAVQDEESSHTAEVSR